MNEIVLKVSSPAEAAQFVSVLLKNGFNPTEATINYNLNKAPSVKLSRVKDFPLILTGTLNGHDMRVAVSQIAIGRPCDGSYALRKILKAAAFYFEERDLFTTRCFNLSTGHLNLTIAKR